MLPVRRDVMLGPTLSESRRIDVKRTRLRAASDFARALNSGRYSTDRYFTVLYCENDLGYARLGLAIAKRNVRLAVQRNRLKRQIRESFRANAPGLPPCDFVVRAKHRAPTAGNQDLARSLQNHWQRIAQRVADDTQRNNGTD